MKKTNWMMVVLGLWLQSQLVAFFDHDLLSAPDDAEHHAVVMQSDDSDDASLVDPDDEDVTSDDDLEHTQHRSATTETEVRATLSLMQAALKKTQAQVARLEANRQDLVRTLERLERQVRVLEAQKQDDADAPKVGTQAPSGLTLQQWYDHAFLALKAKRYNVAAEGFAKVVKQGGQQAVVADAYYWQGQIQIVQANYRDARQTFETLLSQFPKFSKAADVWLKLGMIEARLGHRSRARQRFQKVMKLYPESVASQMAQHALSL